MAWRRAQMIRSVDRLTGRNDCTEAVLAQSRPGWVGMLPAGCLTLGLLFGGRSASIAP